MIIWELFLNQKVSFLSQFLHFFNSFIFLKLYNEVRRLIIWLYFVLLDFFTWNQVVWHVYKIDPFSFFLKIKAQNFTEEAIKLIESLIEKHLEVFLDLKLRLDHFLFKRTKPWFFEGLKFSVWNQKDLLII